MLRFYSTAELPGSAITLDRLAQYNPWIVLVSFLLATFGSYMAILILKSLQSVSGRPRRVGIVLGATVMATAIWSMHYTGMLAYNMTMEHHYDPWLTLLSGLAAIVFALAAFTLLTRESFRYRHIFTSAPLLGMGVASMHYIGMAAMEMKAFTYYKPGLFGISLLIAVGASGAALWLMYRVSNLRGHPLLAHLGAAACMGLAVCGMHYTGMAASVFVPFADCRFDATQDFSALAAIVGLVACVIIGIASSFLLYARQRSSTRTIAQDYRFFSRLQLFALILKFLLFFAIAAIAYEIHDILSQEVTVQAATLAYIASNAKFLLFLCLPGFTLLIIGVASHIQGRKLLAHAIRDEHELGKHRDHLQQLVLEQTETILREQDKLREAKDAAEAASSAKSDFLANMSHELRTPLNCIIGLGQLVMDTPLSEAQHEMLETMEDSSVNLLEIVNDILDISKIETSKLELEYIPFSPHQCVSRVVNMLNPAASKKGLTLVLHIRDSVTTMVYGDPVRYMRIVTNLVGNAIKYTLHGRVDLYVTAASIEAEKVVVKIEVHDTGIGIAPDKLDKVFEKFVQADSSTTRKYGGSGLGLAITKQLVEMMNGTIGVQSNEGKGSVFSFAIPFVISHEAPDNHDSAELPYDAGSIPAADVRVLVAEDHTLNQVYIRRLLAFLGITNFTLVEDGEAAKDAALGGVYDLVLMDCHMPKLNGYDATRAIRAAETDTHLPIIAMTANAMIGERERCLQCGMDEYISKPIDHHLLKKILSRWISFDISSPAISKTRTAHVSETPRLDLTTLKTFSDDDLALEREFAQAFVEQCDAHLNTLRDHCIDGESDAWKELAHSIKGGAATLGAMKLRALAADAQEKRIASKEERIKMTEELQREFELVCDELRHLTLLD